MVPPVQIHIRNSTRQFLQTVTIWRRGPSMLLIGVSGRFSNKVLEMELERWPLEVIWKMGTTLYAQNVYSRYVRWQLIEYIDTDT